MAAPAQRRAQGVLFSFLTIFFAGIAAAAYRADSGAETWVIALASAVLALWMANLAIRTFRSARREITR